MKKIIHTDKAPAAVGPYSQGIAIKDIIFFSGQIPLEPKTGKMVEGGIVAQTNQVLQNIDALLTSQKLTSANVVKATVFLKDLNDFAAVNTEYSKYFATLPPARSCVQVAKLPLDALVEIEIIAHK